MSSSPAFCRIENLTKSYANGRIPVLRNLDLSMSRTDRLVVIGPSGGGKSTLLRCVMGLEEIDSGSVSLEGQPYVTGTPGGTRIDASVRSHVGMVFQSYTLFPHLSVMQNLLLAPVKSRGMPKAEARRRAEDLLSRFGLSEKTDEYPNRLSGGQKQRVAIARALMLDPKLLLFDEVTSALDPELVAEVEHMIVALAEGGMPMMIVTHDMWFAKRVATRIVFCCGGVVMEDGPPEQVFGMPKLQRTRDFVENVLHAG